MVAVTCFVALAIQSDPASVLLTKGTLNCRDWAETANYYIGLGEDAASAELLKNADTGKGKQNKRVILICRILFQGKKKGALRRPSLGTLSLPSLPQSAWPQYPLFEQDGVWFLLDENFMLEDHPETAAKYLEYCEQNGVFRTDKLKVPARQEAVDALKELQSSKRWKAIPWSDSDLHSSYTYHADWTLDLLKAQTHFEGGTAKSENGEIH